MSFGNCQIVARPVLSPEVPRQDSRELSAEGVSYALQDDMHYELEPIEDWVAMGSMEAIQMIEKKI